MPITNNNKPVIDLPGWEVLQPFPATAAVGVCQCNDKRGTGRFVYLLASATSFWRYDVQANTWQQLANPPGGTVGAGTEMIFDPSRGASGYVWALISNGSAAPTWSYYDCAVNTWTARAVTGLPGTFGTDASLLHPCTTYHASGNDDYFYLVGNNATAFYRYSVTANTWTTMAAVTASVGAGCCIEWLPLWDADRFICVRGGATSTVYNYSISGNSWGGLAIQPNTETFTTGTMSCPRGVDSKMFLQKDATGRVYEVDPAALTITPCCTEYLVAPGTAHVGGRLKYVKEANGIEFLYFGLHTSVNFMRSALVF